MRVGLLPAAMLASAILAGCAGPNYSQQSPSEIAGQIRVFDSEFDKNRILMAPAFRVSPQFGLLYAASLSRTQAKADGTTFYMLTVGWEYSNPRWMFFSTATLPGARQLSTVVNDRHVESCTGRSVCRYSERVTSIIPLDVLTQAVANRQGLRIQYGSQQGAVLVELPANYVLGFMQGTSADAVARQPAAAATQPTQQSAPSPQQPAQPSVGKSQEQQLDELSRTPGLSYEEYQRRYRIITGQQ